MTPLLTNPAHWRLRAEEARLLAGELDDLVARASTLAIADEYERLARRASKRDQDESAKANGPGNRISTRPGSATPIMSVPSPHDSDIPIPRPLCPTCTVEM